MKRNIVFWVFLIIGIAAIYPTIKLFLGIAENGGFLLSEYSYLEYVKISFPIALCFALVQCIVIAISEKVGVYNMIVPPIIYTVILITVATVMLCVQSGFNFWVFLFMIVLVCGVCGFIVFTILSFPVIIFFSITEGEDKYLLGTLIYFLVSVLAVTLVMALVFRFFTVCAIAIIVLAVLAVIGLCASGEDFEEMIIIVLR